VSIRWRVSWRADVAARKVADRHYSRQSVGAAQFVPPGRCVVLVIPDVALWITSWPFGEFVKHAWPGAWVCSAFRNERSDLHLSSELITEALAATRFYWTPPAEGMITFVDPMKTRRKRDPGRCFRRAGFVDAGETKGGLVALHIAPGAMPAARQPLGAQSCLIDISTSGHSVPATEEAPTISLDSRGAK
jgi:hypothetical protein